MSANFSHVNPPHGGLTAIHTKLAAWELGWWALRLHLVGIAVL